MNLSIISTKQIAALTLGLGLLGGYSIYNLLSFPKNYRFEPKLAIFSPLNEGSQEIAKSVKQIMQEGSSVADTLKEQLNSEFDELLADLQKAFPLSPEIWKKTLDELKSLKANDTLFTNNPVIKNQKGDIPLVKKVRELLASYNIDPNMVKIQTMNDPKNASYAFAGQCVYNGDVDTVEHYIQLNLAQLPQQTPAIQEALLRHEIMHLINYDPLTFAMIETLFNEQGITPKEFWNNAAYQALNKHIEFRADLMAASHDVAVGIALQDGFTEHMKRYNDAIESKSHPTCKRRQAALDNLVHYMNAEKQIVLA